MILRKIHITDDVTPNRPGEILVPIGTTVLNTDGDYILTLQETNVSLHNRKRWEYIKIHIISNGQDVPEDSKYIGPISNNRYVFLNQYRTKLVQDQTVMYIPHLFHLDD